MSKCSYNFFCAFLNEKNLNFVFLIQYGGGYSAYYHTHYYHCGLIESASETYGVAYCANGYTGDERYGGYFIILRYQNYGQSSEYGGDNVRRNGIEKVHYFLLENYQRNKTYQ